MKTKQLRDKENAELFASVSHMFSYGAVELGGGYSYINYSVLMHYYIRQGEAWCLFDDRHNECHKVWVCDRHLEAVVQIKKYLISDDQDIKMWRNRDMTKVKEAVAYLIHHDARAKAFARYHEKMVLNERELCKPRQYGWNHSVLSTALAAMLQCHLRSTVPTFSGLYNRHVLLWLDSVIRKDKAYRNEYFFTQVGTSEADTQLLLNALRAFEPLRRIVVNELAVHQFSRTFGSMDNNSIGDYACEFNHALMKSAPEFSVEAGLHDALWDPERVVREQAMLNMFPKIMNNIVSRNQGYRDVFHDRILPAIVE